jgi:5-formyltetrahydrofolate cyclo-ligase
MMPPLSETPPEPHALFRAKRAMRDAALAARRAIPHAITAHAGTSVARHFADHPILSFCNSVAGYRAIRGELDVMPVFDAVQRYQRRTFLPRLQGKDAPLCFHAWQLGMPLVTHAMGMEEPEATSTRAIPDLILVPLLAFDADGYRLGYGGGFYDRTIHALRNHNATPPLFIGAGYNSQEVARVPTDAHDQPLDGVITEQGVSIFNVTHPRILR